MKLFIPALLLIGAATAQVQPYRIGGGVKSPSIVSKQEPEYSEEARKVGAVSTVVVSGVVNEHGRAEKLKVAAPVGMGLDESAMETMKSWQFNPGTKEGVPVPVIVSVEINFRLLLSGPLPRRIVFDDPAQPGRPILKNTPRLNFSDGVRQGFPSCVTAKGNLGANGRLSALRFDPGISDQAERELVNQLDRWTFEPADAVVRIEFCTAPPVPKPSPHPND